MSNPDSKKKFYAMAVDIGGTKMATAIVDSFGQLVGKISIESVPRDRTGMAQPESITKWIRAQLNTNKYPLEGIGLSICGNVDEDTGFVPLSANLKWRNVPFGQMVASASSLPVMAATDVRMAALAEATWGVARGVDFFAWATIGTGFGGYLFLDGKLYRGFHGYAGNFGHNSWDEINGVMCGCGKKGCVETFVSGPGIARAGQKIASSIESSLLSQQAKNKPIESRDVFMAASVGDSEAQAILENAQRLTAISLAGLVNILDLEMIVIGGGVASASPDYVEQISRLIRQYLMTEEAKRDLRVEKESFPNAALIGAAGDVFIKRGLLSLHERTQI